MYAIHRSELIGSVGEKRFKKEGLVNRMIRSLISRREYLTGQVMFGSEGS